MLLKYLSKNNRVALVGFLFGAFAMLVAPILFVGLDIYDPRLFILLKLLLWPVYLLAYFLSLFPESWLMWLIMWGDGLAAFFLMAIFGPFFNGVFYAVIFVLIKDVLVFSKKLMNRYEGTKH